MARFELTSSSPQTKCLNLTRPHLVKNPTNVYRVISDFVSYASDDFCLNLSLVPAPHLPSLVGKMSRHTQRPVSAPLQTGEAIYM